MNTRRDFLAVASTALSQARIIGAKDRIRFGIIGAGERGAYLARRLAKRAEAEVVSICDVYRVRADGARDRSNPQADITQDYRRVLDRKDIDAVVISVSDHWHTQILVDSVTAGKDVYLEKPMTYRIEEGHEIVRAVKRTGRVVQVGTQQKSGPHFLAWGPDSGRRCPGFFRQWRSRKMAVGNGFFGEDRGVAEFGGSMFRQSCALWE